jgi:hypothetical protein
VRQADTPWGKRSQTAEPDRRARWRQKPQDRVDGCKESHSDCVHPLGGNAVTLEVLDWRRGWDSNSVRPPRICNLRQPHCRECHKCHRCRGALHLIAPEEPAALRVLQPTPQLATSCRAAHPACRDERATLAAPRASQPSPEPATSSRPARSAYPHERAIPAEPYAGLWQHGRGRNPRRPSRITGPATIPSTPRTGADRYRSCRPRVRRPPRVLLPAAGPI